MFFRGAIEIFSLSHNQLIFTSGTGKCKRTDLNVLEPHVVIRRLGPAFHARAMVIEFRMQDFLNCLYNSLDPIHTLGYLEDFEILFLFSGLLEGEPQ
jgi:hypothetical protein